MPGRSAKGGGGALYELYDHVSDPHETVNVADVPENRDLVANLTKQLNEGPHVRARQSPPTQRVRNSRTKCGQQ